MTHVSDVKKKLVASLAKLIKAYPTVGSVDLEGMPSSQLQKMRVTLRKNDILLILAKRRLIKLAIEDAKKDKQGIEELETNLNGMPSLIFAKIDSFKLYRLLKQSKSPASAKPGQICPKEIVIKAGPTSFMPGPIISELSKFGIKAGVEAGKIAIKHDAVVCRAGEKISDKLADLLSKFNIKPMEIGLNLTATYENGVIFKKQVLDVDEDKIKEQLTQAAQESFNLSVEAGYFTKENIEIIVRNVFYSCKALAEESKFMADVVVEDMLAGAERSAKSLQISTKIETLEKKEEKALEEVKEIIKEEQKVEVKPIKKETSVEMSEIAQGVHSFASANSKPAISECLKAKLSNKPKICKADFSVHAQELASDFSPAVLDIVISNNCL